MQTPYDPANIFARILRGELPCARLYEDSEVLAFMDAFPQTKGHCLVIPKSTSVNLFDISQDLLGTLIIRTQLIARAVRDSLKPDGIQIIQYNGAAGGQSVFHLHFHIVPRWVNTPINVHGSGVMADLADLTALAERIRLKL